MDEPLPQPEPWVYKPNFWDHEELHMAYDRHPMPELPPDSISVTTLKFDGEKASQKLQADHEENTFERTDSPPIRFVNIRYVSTNCRALCEDHVADHRFIIMISVRRWEDIDIPEECYVHNLFIQPESAEQALAILNFLQYHIFQYFQKETNLEDPTLALEFIRPRLLQECKVRVHWRKFRKTWTEKRTVVLDPECVIFYRKAFNDAHEPRDRMFFWYEQFRKTVSKVSRIKSQNCILLHSTFMYITLEYEDETGPDVEAAFKEVQPVPRRAFQEPNILFHWVAGNYDAEEGKILPPVPEIERVVLDEEQTQKLNQFEKELNEGLFEHANDQSQTIWNNIRPHLEENLMNNKLPKVDEKQLDYDPNSVDSLLTIVPLIETELFHNVNYDKALSFTVAMRNLFLKSKVDRLSTLLGDDPVDILHKIHARGNISGRRSLESYETNVLLEEMDDDVGNEEEFDEEEEMEDLQDPQD